MTETITGAQLVARALIDRKIEHIFSLSGGHITPIYQHLEGSSVKIFDTRHEQSAVFMAEAFGKLTRKAGVAMVTAGPGFTNALTGIASAHFQTLPWCSSRVAWGWTTRKNWISRTCPRSPSSNPWSKRPWSAGRRNGFPNMWTWLSGLPRADGPARFTLNFPLMS